MEYISTRGEAPVLGFRDALLAGLARDGGLYVPREWVTPADVGMEGLTSIYVSMGITSKQHLGAAQPGQP